MAAIDWNDSAAAIHNKVRGMNPWPVAKTVFCGKILKIFAGRPLNAAARYPAGSLYSEKGDLFVSCGEGVYRIDELQLEGAKRMNSSDFLRGHPVSGPIRLE